MRVRGGIGINSLFVHGKSIARYADSPGSSGWERDKAAGGHSTAECFTAGSHPLQILHVGGYTLASDNLQYGMDRRVVWVTPNKICTSSISSLHDNYFLFIPVEISTQHPCGAGGLRVVAATTCLLRV